MKIFAILVGALSLALSNAASAQSPIIGTPIKAPAGFMPGTAIYCDNGAGAAALCSFASGGGGGGTGDASAANQTTQIAAEQAIRDRIGALTSPAAGSTNFILTDIRTLLGGTLTVGTHAVTQSGTWTVTTSPIASTSTSVGGTIGSANAYQSALAASATRRGCLIKAKSGAALSIYIGAPGSATAAASIDLDPGVAFSCVAGGMVIADQISIASATAGATYVVVSQ